MFVGKKGSRSFVAVAVPLDSRTAAVEAARQTRRDCWTLRQESNGEVALDSRQGVN